MLNAPLPPDITVTDRLQRVISEWKGAVGHRLDRLFQDCLDLVGSEKQLLPRRIIPVHELDGSTLERALKRFHFPLNYAVDTVGRFEAALIPILRENEPAVGFLFAYEEDLSLQDQVALFAHAVGHLILNDQVRLKELELPLNPDDGEIHTDRLSELRYLDISRNRNFLDRQVLEAFPRLTHLIEPPEESQILLERSTRDLEIMLRKRGWVNQFVRMRYRYTHGRVIPNSKQRGKRQVVDALLRAEASLPTAVIQVQRSDEALVETVGRARNAAQYLSVPFAYILTTQQEVIELHWLTGSMSEPLLRTTLPERPTSPGVPNELLSRWLSALQLDDAQESSALTYPYELTQTPRYYQDAAINWAVIAALQARKGLRPRRILLTLATGTGKTQVAFQILWKLKKTYSVRNVLFLADRGYLLDQAQNNTFGPFGDAIKRGLGEIDTAHDILFGSYQWLTTLQDGVERYKGYPSDYFDVIVIDECHRGSADEDSNWRRVLAHFSEAVQIGLTATPLETKDVQTNQYFGAPVYTYTLSQGINDGYLAPYSVRRVVIDKEEHATKQAADQPVETLDQQIVIQTGSIMRQYTQIIAEHLAQYLQLQDDPRLHKTIVFCVDNKHAADMRLALEQTCATWARPGDIVRIVDDDKEDGKRALNQFCTVRECQPVIVTTARLLTTGIDVPTCQNIVLARGVGSIVEFKQIIGRGTRLFEPQKSWFTIIDYAGAVKHFSDPAFDGDPVSVQREYLFPPVPVSEDESADTNEQTTPTSSPMFAAEQSELPGTNGQEGIEQPAQEATYPRLLTEAGIEDSALDSSTTPELRLSVEHNLAYESQGAAANTIPDTEHPQSMEIDDPGRGGTLRAPGDHTKEHNDLGRGGTLRAPGDHTEEHNDLGRGGTLRAPGDQQQSSSGTGRTQGAAPTQVIGQNTEERPTQRREPEITIEKANGHRFVISGEFSYELDASGTRLREGSNTQFAQQALKDMVKTPEDLRAYWTNRQERKLLIEQLASEVVGLDALAAALHLPDIDHYDLLRHILFQQPPITRLERVQRLQAAHSTFFQRFEHNPLAKELLDAILEKYILGDAPDVSNVELLSVPPLSARTRMEWVQAFSQASPKTSINATLKDLQQLLYG